MAKYFKDNFGYILVWVLAAIPVVVWVFMLPIVGRFASASRAFQSLGQIAGLLGMALLSINFILAARFKFLDRWFNGLNRVYIKHHLIGSLAFGLLLLHPTFLIIQYLFVSLQVAFGFLFSFSNFYLVLGEVALLVFIVLLVITLYFNFKYHIWKNTHQYLGIVLFLGAVHMIFIPSNVSNSILLKFYMVTLALLGAISYVHRVIFPIHKKNNYEYKLEEIKEVAKDIFELKLTPISKKISFLAGQFVFIKFKVRGPLSESHPFSISSSPNQSKLTFGIKNLGDYTALLKTLKLGTVCSIEGPFGVFSYKNVQNKNQIWVAGGIGITPFLGMARDIGKDKSNDYKIDLYYSTKNENEAAFATELSEIARQNNNFKFYQHFSERAGFITADFIYKKNNDSKNTEIFLCGPSGFMKSLREQFISLGFDNGLIHSEEFSL